MTGKLTRKLLAVIIAVGLFLLAVTLGGCARASAGPDSPRLAKVRLSATSAMTEESQAVTVRLGFDRPIAVTGDVLADLELLLNGTLVDASAVRVEVLPSAEAVSLVLTPSSAQKGSANYFALYESRFAVSSVNEDGSIPSIEGATGDAAVIEKAVEGTLPSGMVLEVLDREAGSVAAGVPARATVRVVAPPQVRAITWFSLDGGQTVLLKHNHLFADATVESCAQDLARVVNAAAESGIVAQARQDTITFTANSVKDGQVIEPVVVEGIGRFGAVLTEEERRAMP